MNLSMIKQALELKSKLQKTQKELAKMTVEAEAGNGAVKVTASGSQKMLSTPTIRSNWRSWYSKR
jgi:DNA-binding protein YbaB